MDARQHTLEILNRLVGDADSRGALLSAGAACDARSQNQPKRRIARPVESIKVLYSVAVWGDPYIDIFLALSLPGFLSNLAGLPNNEKSLFVLHTQPEDQPRFESASQFQALRKLVPVIFLNINVSSAGGTNKYGYLSASQSEAKEIAKEYDAIVFLYADFIWGEGAIAAGINRIAESYDAVVLPVPPLVREDFVEAVARNPSDFLNFDNGYPLMTMPSRKLIALGKKIMHPLMRDNTLDYEDNTNNSAYVLWLGPNDDYLIRCFHMHPLILRVQKDNREFWDPIEGTLDENFVPHILRDADRIYFVTDSDEAAIVSLTPRLFPVGYLPKGKRIGADDIVQWAELGAASIHRLFFDVASIWHEHHIDGDAWRSTIKRSDTMARYIRRALSTPDSVIRAEDKLLWRSRIFRAKRVGKKKSRGSWQEFFEPWLPTRTLMIELLARFWSIMPEFIRRQIRGAAAKEFATIAKVRSDARALHRAPVHLLFTAVVVSLFRKK